MLDPGGGIDDAAGLVQREFLPRALMRTVAVVVPRVLVEDLAQVPLADDQQ